MSEIDWSKAPEWAVGLGLIGAGEYMVWFDDEKYIYVDDRSCGRPFKFESKPYGEWSLGGLKSVVKRPSPAWSGEGLPPAGVVCEISKLDGCNTWIKAEILFITKSCVVFKADMEEKALYTYELKFRPIRTPEQIAEDERKSEISFMASCIAHSNCRHAPTDHDIAAAAHLHYLGYRKP